MGSAGYGPNGCECRHETTEMSDHPEDFAVPPIPRTTSQNISSDLGFAFASSGCRLHASSSPVVGPPPSQLPGPFSPLCLVLIGSSSGGMRLQLDKSTSYFDIAVSLPTSTHSATAGLERARPARKRGDRQLMPHSSSPRPVLVPHDRKWEREVKFCLLGVVLAAKLERGLGRLQAALGEDLFDDDIDIARLEDGVELLLRRAREESLGAWRSGEEGVSRGAEGGAKSCRRARRGGDLPWPEWKTSKLPTKSARGMVLEGERGRTCQPPIS